MVKKNLTNQTLWLLVSASHCGPLSPFSSCPDIFLASTHQQWEISALPDTLTSGIIPHVQMHATTQVYNASASGIWSRKCLGPMGLSQTYSCTLEDYNFPNLYLLMPTETLTGFSWCPQQITIKRKWQNLKDNGRGCLTKMIFKQRLWESASWEACHTITVITVLGRTPL